MAGPANDADNLPMWRLLAALIAASIGVPILVVSIYFYSFAPGHWFALSHNPDEWAKFGEYVGGSLGAFFGFLAFFGVLVTIAIQRSQARLNELQRLMAIVSHEIDLLFKAEPSVIAPDVRDRMRHSGASLTVHTVLAGIGTAAIDDRAITDLLAPTVLLRRGLDQIRGDAGVIVIELQQLVQLLHAYTKAGGGAVITSFYENRYRVQVAWLQVTGLLSSQIVETHFGARQYVEDLRERARRSQPAVGQDGRPAI